MSNEFEHCVFMGKWCWALSIPSSCFTCFPPCLGRDILSLLWGIIPYHGLVCSPKSSFSGPFSLDFLILISLSLLFHIKYLLLLQLINYQFVMQLFYLNKITLNLKLFCCDWSQKTRRKSHFETRTRKTSHILVQFFFSLSGILDFWI